METTDVDVGLSYDGSPTNVGFVRRGNRKLLGLRGGGSVCRIVSTKPLWFIGGLFFIMIKVNRGDNVLNNRSP